MQGIMKTVPGCYMDKKGEGLMKKKVSVLFSAAALFACTAGINTYAEGNQPFFIGICQFAQHESLDAAAQGFKDAVSEKMGN